MKVGDNAHKTLTGNRDGRPDVYVPPAVTTALGIEIGEPAAFVVDGDRAILTAGEPAQPDGGVRAGDTITVEFGPDELEAARARLPDDADRVDALGALADVADLGERYRTADGRDAADALLDD